MADECARRSSRSRPSRALEWDGDDSSIASEMDELALAAAKALHSHAQHHNKRRTPRPRPTGECSVPSHPELSSPSPPSSEGLKSPLSLDLRRPRRSKTEALYREREPPVGSPGASSDHLVSPANEPAGLPTLSEEREASVSCHRAPMATLGLPSIASYDSLSQSSASSWQTEDSMSFTSGDYAE